MNLNFKRKHYIQKRKEKASELDNHAFEENLEIQSIENLHLSFESLLFHHALNYLLLAAVMSDQIDISL